MSEPKPIAHCSECDKPLYHEWEWTLHEHPCTNDLVEDYEEYEDGRIGVAHEKLLSIYRLAHAFNTRHSCHHVHDIWREGLKKLEARGGSGSE